MMEPLLSLQDLGHLLFHIHMNLLLGFMTMYPDSNENGSVLFPKHHLDGSFTALKDIIVTFLWGVNASFSEY